MLSIGKKYRVDEVPEETFAEWAAICNEDGTKHIDLIDGVYYIKANPLLRKKPWNKRSTN